MKAFRIVIRGRWNFHRSQDEDYVQFTIISIIIDVNGNRNEKM